MQDEPIVPTPEPGGAPPAPAPSHPLLRLLPPSLRARLAGRAGAQLVVANVVWLLLDRVLRLGVGLLVTVWVARYLGPQQFGILNYAIAFVGLFGFASTLGLDSIVIRDLVRSPDDAALSLGSAFALKLCGAVATLLLAVGSVPWLRPGDPAMVGLVAVIAAGTLAQSFDVVDLWFQAQVRSKYVTWARTAAFLVISAVKVVLILAQAPLLAFAYAGLAELALAALGLVAAYQLTGQTIRRWRASLDRARALLRVSWPLMLASLAVWTYMRIDQVMLGTLADDRALGVYAAAVRLSEVWYFIPVAIVSSVFPAVVRAKAVSEELYYERLQRLFSLLAALAYAVCVPASLLAGPLVRALYGPTYGEASTMLVVLMWAGLFAALGVARETWVVAEGLTRFSFASVVIGATVNVMLNLIFIPRWGALGAAWATLAAQAVAVCFSTVLYAPTRRLFAMQMKALVLRGGLRP